MTALDVFRRLEAVVGISGRPHNLFDVIEEELIKSFGLPPIQAAEKAQQLERKVVTIIEKNRADAEVAGTISTIVISGDNDRAICGSCWIESFDGPDVQAAKKRRLQIEPVLRAIQGLNFAQFERFGAAVLKELGAKTVKVTPHSNDQGIDFFGVLSIADLGVVPEPFLQMTRDVTIRFAGQAKHYPMAALGPSVIRELIGAITLARHKIRASPRDPFEELHLLALHPLLGMVFTTGRFTGGALKLAQNAGLIARSGEQLSVFLADRGVGYVAGNFSDEEFRRWLET